MMRIGEAVRSMYNLEKNSIKKSLIHSINPMVKLMITCVYIVTIVSFGRYSFINMLPYILYPAIIIPLSDLRYKTILNRSIMVLPFCFFAGITNIFFDRIIIMDIFGIEITAGIISFLTIILKSLLSVSAVLILISVTPFNIITNQLRKLYIPESIVVILEMIYRYISSIFAEMEAMQIAYKLRGGGKAIDIKHIGSFIGQLFLRSADRAERVYKAMQCRGFKIAEMYNKREKFCAGDVLFAVVTAVPCIVCRFLNISQIIGLFMWRIL